MTLGLTATLCQNLPKPSGFLKETLVPQQQETVARVWGSSLLLPFSPHFAGSPRSLGLAPVTSHSALPPLPAACLLPGS